MKVIVVDLLTIITLVSLKFCDTSVKFSLSQVLPLHVDWTAV